MKSYCDPDLIMPALT